MPQITAVSFDADGVRVVTGRRTGTGFTVERTLSLTADELDPFLALDRADGYLVAANPVDALFETITIPPVGPKLEAPLIRAETARLHPELLPFSCGWHVLGDTPLEGRTVRRIACCLVPHRSLEPLLEPFIRHRKRIRQLVAAPVALATLVKTVEATDEPLLCVHDSGSSKLLFLLEGGAVTFSRAISSSERGWDAFDRQNVAMTLDYCFQSLRVRPNRVLVLNPSQPLDDSAPPPRLEPLSLPPQFQGGKHATLMTDYQAPFLLAAWPMPATADLLPERYRTAQLQQLFLQRSCRIAAAFSALLLLLVLLEAVSLQRTEREIDTLRLREKNLSAIVQAHQQALAQRDRVQPLISAVSTLVTGPDIPATLVALNGLSAPPARLQSLTVRHGQGGITLHLAGSVAAPGFAAAEEQFEAVSAALRRCRGVTPTASHLDPKSQTFTIEATATP